MNDLDALMRNAWQATRPRDARAALLDRVRRHRRRRRFRRGLEIALTLLAVALLLSPLRGAAIGPAYWLVMPFFVAYVPAVWWWLLRAPRSRVEVAALDVSAYAQVRLVQIRTGLRELRIARIAGLALLGYAAAVTIGTLMVGDPPWREAGVRLLLFSVAWTVATLWITRTRGRRDRREYRAMRRLSGHAR